MITKYGNGAVVQIPTVIEPVYDVAFERGLFGHISNHVFRSA